MLYYNAMISYYKRIVGINPKPQEERRGLDLDHSKKVYIKAVDVSTSQDESRAVARRGRAKRIEAPRRIITGVHLKSPSPPR